RPMNEWYNVATDKNVYWLTTSSQTGGTPKRYTPKAPAKQNSKLTVNSGSVFLHHERDFFYYYGDAGNEEQTKQETEYNHGERFEWSELHGPNIDSSRRGDTSRVIDTMIVTSLPADAASRTAHFKFLSRGMSSNTSGGGVHHWVFARLNG